MTTCRDCIHFDVCGMCGYEDDIRAMTFCSYFKDKSRFVELPCKIGHYVYYIYEITNYKGEHRYVLRTNKIKSIDIHEYYKYYSLFDRSVLISDDYNKTWFTDKSKAKAKLKELNK